MTAQERTNRHGNLAADSPSALDCLIEALETAWRDGREPQISATLARTDSAVTGNLRTALLHELICVDLEYRWKAPMSAARHMLDDYVAAHPELGELRQLPIALIAEEYRVRHRWGGKPEHAEYFSRFGDRAGEIAAVLQQVDAELGDEAEAADAAILLRTVPVRPLRRAPQYDERAPLDYRDFILQTHLGSGGIGKVYRARQRSLDRPVAVKMLKKQWLQFPTAVEQFLQEAKTVAGLRHPNLVGVHGLGRTPHGGYFIVMDFIDGRDLSDVMAAGAIRLADAVHWVAQAADALAYAHASGIIHCDLKPSNLLLDRNGKIFVTDFGFALPVEGVRDRRCIGGTLGYLAPEQLAGDVHGLSPATDVYGLGAVLNTLLSGRRPGRSEPLPGSFRTLPFASGEKIPPALKVVLARCLAADSRERFPSAGELAWALRLAGQ